MAAKVEKTNQESDIRHPLRGNNCTRSRIKSKKYFLKTTISLTQTPETIRIDLWKKEIKGYNSHLWKYPKESLPPCSNLPWSTWKKLNRLRTKTARTAINMKKWILKEDVECDCGQEEETIYFSVHY